MSIAPSDLTHLVLGLVTTARTWEGDPVTDLIERLLTHTPEMDQRFLPSALALTARAVLEETELLDLVLDAILALDLYEAAGHLAPLVRDYPTEGLLKRAASLSAHPGADPQLADIVQLAVSSLAASEAELVRMSFDPNIAAPIDYPQRAWEAALATRWPGSVTLDRNAPPMILIHEDAGSYADVMRLVQECRAMGARARRVPRNPSTTRVHRNWTAGWMPILVRESPSEDRPEWWQALPHGKVIATGGALPPSARRDVLQRVRRALPATRKLRSKPVQDISPVNSILDTEVFFDGALNYHETAFLAGLSPSTIGKYARREAPLTPRMVGNENFFSFPQLVGLRTWAFINKTMAKRYDISVASRFVRLAESRQETRFAVGEDGKILFEVSEGTYADEAGQTTSSTFFPAAHVFRLFQLGHGRTAPDLERPSVHTFVNPSIHRGTPVVVDTRIPAAAVRALASRARRSGKTQREVTDFIRGEYGDLEAAVISDAESIASKYS